MRIVKPGFEFLGDVDGVALMKNIERAKRVCYKSEDKITDESYKDAVRDLIARGHDAMLEHGSISVIVTADRAVLNEIVRHRIASYAQSSTRYCNFSKDKFGNEISVIEPFFFPQESMAYYYWYEACKAAEDAYMELLSIGRSPEEARSVLPLSLASEIVITMNPREWRHFFKLRACGASGKPHPQMLEIAVPMLDAFKAKFPELFDDLEGLEFEAKN